jgi:hypothetical protein
LKKFARAFGVLRFLWIEQRHHAAAEQHESGDHGADHVGKEFGAELRRRLH